MKPEQITAWALNEASVEERVQLEAALQENPQDKVKADEMKAFCDFLLSELRDDSLALTDKQRERLVAQAKQPVGQSSRLPDASETLALQPEAGGKAAKTTRWNFGVIVRLSLAACAVLGGIWTWQAYSSRRSEARAVAVVTEKPGIKVQLAKKPEPKKSAGQGPETRLLAAAPAKPVIVAEQPVAKTLPPAALADAGAMTLQPAKRAEAEKLRQMTESHFQEYRQLVTEAQKLQKLAQDPSLPADLRGTYAAELNVKTKAVRALEKEMQERSDAKPQTAALVLNKDQHAMTPADLERLKRVQDERAYGLSFGGVMAGMPPAAEPQMSLAAGGVAAAGSLGQMGTDVMTQKMEPSPSAASLVSTSRDATVGGGSAMVSHAPGMMTMNGGMAFMSMGANIVLPHEPESRTGRLTLFKNHWVSLEGILREPWQYNRWQPLAPMASTADSVELVSLHAGATLAEYQPSVAFGSPSVYGPWFNSVGEAWLELTAANASSGSIVVQAGAPLTAHAALQALNGPLPHLGTVSPLSSLWYNCCMSFPVSFSIHPSFPLKPELNANSPGLITFATAASVPFNAAHERGGHLAEEMIVSDGRGIQAAVNVPVKAERGADVHATGGMNGAVPGLLDIAGGEIQNDPFKVRSSSAGVGHDFVPPSQSFGYSFIHNMGSLAGGGGINHFTGGLGGYGMNDMQQLTLGVNTPLGSGRLALSASDELSNGNVATASGVETNGTRTAVLGAPVALEVAPQAVEFDGYVNYGSLILGSSAGSGKVSSSGPVSGVQPAAASKPVFAIVGAQEPKELGEVGKEGKVLGINGGTVRLTGGNTFTGGTVVNAGTLNVTGGNAIQVGDAPAASSVRGYMHANAPVTFSGALTPTGAAPAAAPASPPAGIAGGWATTDQEVATFNNTAQGLKNPVAGAAGGNVRSAPAAPATFNAMAAGAVDMPQVLNPEPASKAGLQLAGSSSEIGNSNNTATTRYMEVVRRDYNEVASQGTEGLENKKLESFKAPLDPQRSQMMAQITETSESKVPTLTVAGGAVVSKDGKTDDFYFGRNAMPEERKAERPAQPSAGESYTRIIENEMKEVAREPLSTLSIDVDTASYANVRRFLNQNMLPPPDAVRIEELINYFPTAEEGPAHEAKEPFAVRVELAPCPWQPVHRLARISIKGREMDKDRKASNLVFLVDVSGSMNEPAKLPLVQQSLRMLTEQLGEEDHVTMVVYAGSSGVVLPPTSGEKKEEILGAINRLSAGGSTHGSAGIQLAYEQAVAGFIKGGVNRVILCTDGDFNVGVSSPEELEKLIKHKAKTGVFLSVLGFGSGNLKDRTMETLADKGNGNYAYIDSLSEARKVLVEQMCGTLDTIAKDVKIQVEFNPAAVRGYRLIGYENRVMAKEDFNDDTKDAGEIGAGHSVVALYEVVPANLPAGAEGRPAVDSLKYQAPAIPPAQLAEAAKSGETMTVKLRYKEPESDLSKLIEMPVKDAGQTLTASTEEFKFSAAVAGFGLLLRDSSYKGTLGWETVRRLALDGKGADKLGYRGEFLQLIDKARGLKETR